MAVTTKSNSNKVVEVIKLALKFIYYFHIYFFFLARLKVLEEKKKKSNIRWEWKWLHTKYVSLHPVSYRQNLIYLLFTSTMDLSVFSHCLGSPGGRDKVCGCLPPAAECRETATLMLSPQLDLANLVSWTTLTAAPEVTWLPVCRLTQGTGVKMIQIHFDSSEGRTQDFQVPGKCL